MGRLEVTEAQRQELHYAYGLATIAFLHLPFARPADQSQPKIEEGWFYGEEELAVHNMSPYHCRLDYQKPYGTPVLAPCNGVAIATFQGGRLREEGSQRKYQGQDMYWGLGYFVQIYNRTAGRYVQLGHLSDIASTVPFSLPTYDNDDGWDPINYRVRPTQLYRLLESGQAARVNRGQLIGNIGHSGLGLDYCDYQKGMTRPEPIDPRKELSYDDDHLDMAVLRWQGKNRIPMDPYGIYGHRDQYPPDGQMRNPFWVLNAKGLPKYADED